MKDDFYFGVLCAAFYFAFYSLCYYMLEKAYTQGFSDGIATKFFQKKIELVKKEGDNVNESEKNTLS